MVLRKKTAIITALFMMACMCLNTVMASAESDTQSLSDLLEEIDEKEQALEEGKEKVADLSSEIAELEQAISVNEDKLVVLEAELKEAEEKVNTQTENLNARLRNMYKSGSIGFLDVLLDSSSFSEFLNNLDMVEIIYTSDQELLDQLQAAHDEVEQKKNEVETLQAELKDSKKVVEDEKARIAASNEETEAMLDELEKEAEALTAKIRAQGSSSANSNYTGGEMAWPCPQYARISCYFGGRVDPITGVAGAWHGGMDIAASGGNPIVAANPGVVISAGYNGGYGYCVIIDHGGGVTTLYGHCSKLLVSSGQTVSRGEQIAKVGTTGRSTGNHLHFEVRIDGNRVDPLPYIT